MDIGTKSQQHRPPPHDIDTEAALLGAMLLSRDAIAVAVEVLDMAYFYRPAHSQVFKVICDLYSQGNPADPVTVNEHLERTHPKTASDIGGRNGLMDLQIRAPVISNAEYYAAVVKDHYMMRSLIEVASKIAEIGYSRTLDVPEAVDHAENLVYQIAQGHATNSVLKLNEVLSNTFDHLSALYENDSDITGTHTGYNDLDALLSGLQARSLYVIGARPSTGKTAFALGIANNISVRQRRPVILFSLEMGHLEVAQRLLSVEAQVEASRIRTGKLTEADWGRIASAMETMAEAPLYIDDNPSVTVTEIRARARRIASQIGDIGLILVDYLQLMTGRKGADNRQLEVAEISRGLKILARELNCPVIAISQLSRNLEMRQNKRPILADLRESGAIEQDADVVMFIYRDEMYNPDNHETNGTAEIIVAKNRNGPTSNITMAFLSRFVAFKDLATHNDYHAVG